MTRHPDHPRAHEPLTVSVYHRRNPDFMCVEDDALRRCDYELVAVMDLPGGPASGKAALDGAASLAFAATNSIEHPWYELAKGRTDLTPCYSDRRGCRSTSVGDAILVRHPGLDTGTLLHVAPIGFAPTEWAVNDGHGDGCPVCPTDDRGRAQCPPPTRRGGAA